MNPRPARTAAAALFVALLVALLPAAAPAALRALVVGIDAYPVFGALQRSRSDAAALARLLVQQGFCEPEQLRLLGEDAPNPDLRPTRAGIRQQAAALAADAEEGDVLLFFFSGHAISSGEKGDGFLVPMEGLAGEPLSLHELRRTFAGSKAAGALVILDVARRGSTAQGVGRVAPQVAGDRFLLFLACDVDEVSYDDDASGHTVFVRALLDVLGGWTLATPLAAEVLQRRVAERVLELNAGRNRAQNPRLFGGGAQPFLLLGPGDAAAATAGADAPRPRVGQAWTVPGLDLDLLPLQPGEYVRGSLRGDADEQPQHRVTLTRPAWLGRCEVTQAQYAALMEENPSAAVGSILPVHKVSWRRAVEFCRRLQAREAAAGRVPEGFLYRLPTEAEWEYACRAGSRTEYVCGDQPTTLYLYANFTRRVGRRRADVALPEAAPGDTPGLLPVAAFRPNAWGFHDMHGSVWEWCLDYYAVYRAGDVVDPTGPPDGFFRVARGGGWADPAVHARSASRGYATEEYVSVGLGFRVMLGPVLDAAAAGGAGAAAP
jgi:formylglycine-generating enzyme required for sulfatase activity